MITDPLNAAYEITNRTLPASARDMGDDHYSGLDLRLGATIILKEDKPTIRPPPTDRQTDRQTDRHKPLLLSLYFKAI